MLVTSTSAGKCLMAPTTEDFRMADGPAASRPASSTYNFRVTKMYILLVDSAHLQEKDPQFDRSVDRTSHNAPASPHDDRANACYHHHATHPVCCQAEALNK